MTYTLSDGKKIQKVMDVVTGTGSVVRAVSFQINKRDLEFTGLRRYSVQ